MLADRPYRLAPYDSLTKDQRHELGRSTSRAEYAAVRRDRRFILRKVWYRSDGLRVVAYVYGPAAGRARRP